MPAPVAFELQPHLTGERLELRPLEPGDYAALYAAASDPLIWEQHPEPDRWREDVFRAYFDGGLASGGALVVLDRANGRIVGSSRYAHLTLDGAEVEYEEIYHREDGSERIGSPRRLPVHFFIEESTISSNVSERNVS